MTATRLGHYRILQKIGAGGMGEVYRARDEKLDRDVAIKVLPSSNFSDTAARARLLQEARAAGGLNHAHICTIHEVGEADGQTYIAMELVEGEPLSSRLHEGPLTPAEVVRFGLQLADALAHAHERGVIHRDLKSANVMITPDGRLKMLDFGLAKRFSTEELSEGTTGVQLTTPGAVVGTLAYIAPEQLRGLPADARSDIWALGVVLYEMSTGTRPFPGHTSFELSSAILSQPPVPLPRKVPEELEAVIQRCLIKEPARRYQHAGEVRAVLEALPSRLGLSRLPPRARRQRRPRRSVIRALAVLPLANMSRDPEQDYFAEGMTEQLITDLSKIGALKVISRTSSMRYKGTSKSLPEIAEELKVDAVVEGSVLRVGDRVRITAQLIHALSDSHLWAESYERDTRDVLLLQSEVARAIARQIEVVITPEETRRLAIAPRVDPAAQEAYLRGRYAWNKTTEEGWNKAIAYFNEAIEKDPGFALAWAGLGEAYAFLGEFSILVPGDTYPRAEAAATRALQLDDTVAEAHATLGIVKLEYDKDWAAAEREFKRGIELNPSSPNAHQFYSWYLGAMTRMEESLSEMRRASELDPLSMFRSADLGLGLYMFSQFDRAIEQLQKTLELDPDMDYAHWIVGLAYVKKARFQEAIAHLEKAALSGDSPMYLAGLGYGNAVAGRRDEANRILSRLNEMSQLQYVSPYFIAVVYAGLGENDKALEELERARQVRASWLCYLRVQPEFDSLRSEPRFQDLLRQMNFPQ